MEIESRPRGSWLLGDDMTGRTSGRLVVIGPAEKPPDAAVKFRGTWWLCRCQCGTVKAYPRQYITQKTVQSCGCMKRGPKASVNEAALVHQKSKPGRKKKPIKLASSCEGLATECTCAGCGKTFDRLSDKWVYKATVGTRLYWFCTWKCLRKAQNKANA